MNLKESFRYQKFLDEVMREAHESICIRDHAYIATKTHHKNKANPDAEDLVETVDTGDFFPPDTVISFMEFLVQQKEALTKAISDAKAGCGINIDAAIETNKFRQGVSSSIRSMTCRKPVARTETGTDYKFNVEGNQMRYYYDIEITYEENYTEDKAKEVMRRMIAEADEVSAKIDQAMVTTQVDYHPPFNVNETFDDVMTEYINRFIAAK